MPKVFVVPAFRGACDGGEMGVEGGHPEQRAAGPGAGAVSLCRANSPWPSLLGGSDDSRIPSELMCQWV